MDSRKTSVVWGFVIGMGLLALLALPHVAQALK
jgi:hypothetical protein